MTAYSIRNGQITPISDADFNARRGPSRPPVARSAPTLAASQPPRSQPRKPPVEAKKPDGMALGRKSMLKAVAQRSGGDAEVARTMLACSQPLTAGQKAMLKTASMQGGAVGAAARARLEANTLAA